MNQQISSKIRPNKGSAIQEFRSRPWAATLILVGGLVLLALGIAVSVSFGAADIKLSVVWVPCFTLIRRSWIIRLLENYDYPVYLAGP